MYFISQEAVLARKILLKRREKSRRMRLPAIAHFGPISQLFLGYLSGLFDLWIQLKIPVNSKAASAGLILPRDLVCGLTRFRFPTSKGVRLAYGSSLCIRSSL